MKNYKVLVTFQKKLVRFIMFLSAAVFFSVASFIGKDAVIKGYIYDPFFIFPLILVIFVAFILFYKGWKLPIPTEYIIFEDRVEARRGKKVISRVNFNSIRNIYIDKEGPTAGKIMAGSIFVDVTGGKAEKYVLIETEYMGIYFTPINPDKFVEDLKNAIKNYKKMKKPERLIITERERYDAPKRALFYLLFIKTPAGYMSLILLLTLLLLFYKLPIKIIIISIIAFTCFFEFLIYFYSEKITSSMLRSVPLDRFISGKQALTDLKYDISFPIEVAPYISLTNAMATGLTPKKSKIIVSQKLLKQPINVQNAILRHEEAHINNKDILKMFLLSLVFNASLTLLILIFPSTKITGVIMLLSFLILGIIIKPVELRADITSVRNETEANDLIKALTEIGREIEKLSAELLSILGKEEKNKQKTLDRSGIERPRSIFRRIVSWMWIHPPIYIRIKEINNFKRYKSKSLLYFTPKLLYLMVTDIL